jgi:hypothetical protein
MSAAPPVPCRTGKNRVKIFLGETCGEKSNVIIGVSTALGKTSRAWQGKPNRTRCVWDAIAIATIIIYN